MENKISFSACEISLTDSNFSFKTHNPFSVITIKKEDFTGVNVLEENWLPHSDWNYAFRFAGIGIVLMITCFGLAYGIDNSLQNSIGIGFLYLGVAFAQLITIGAIIIILSLFDAFMGTTITIRLLMKCFGKKVMKVVITSTNNQDLIFYLNNTTDKDKIKDVMQLNNIFN